MEKSNHINMDEKDLEKLSKSELIEFILKQQKPVPTPRNMVQAPIPAPRTKKPTPEKRTIIAQVETALRGYTKSFDIQLRDKINPLIQLQKSRQAINYLFKNLLIKTKGFKFIETLQVNFVKRTTEKKGVHHPDNLAPLELQQWHAK